MSFMKKLSQKNHGWTLVELLVVVVIVGILALVIMAKMSMWTDKAKESKTKDALRDLRVQIKRYYAENGGFYPEGLDDVQRKSPSDTNVAMPAFIPHFMNKIPKVCLGGNVNHKDTAFVYMLSTTDADRLMDTGDINDQSGWVYSSTTGEIRINCTHEDRDKRTRYSNYGYEAME
ncbi:prepilin-type N-terminal cleavage/methylation domain-containing protein [Candidatus Desantisbacteria bacterium]|nr:prepilin-type N-terminal cleavage/methylation domain-containing protein [Candidatus Desantisbacteria bacterium]